MWERFDEHARRAIYFAQEEAKTLGSRWVSTEHLLLGLLHDGETDATTIFWALKLDPVDVRTQLMKLVRQGEPRVFDDMSLTMEGKRAVDLASREAKRLGHEHIGPGHLFLGVIAASSGIDSSRGIVARVFKRLGANLEAAREAAKLLDDGPES